MGQCQDTFGCFKCFDRRRAFPVPVSRGLNRSLQTLKTIKQKAEELGFSARTVQWIQYDGELYNTAHEDSEGVPLRIFAQALICAALEFGMTVVMVSETASLQDA